MEPKSHVKGVGHPECKERWRESLISLMIRCSLPSCIVRYSESTLNAVLLHLLHMSRGPLVRQKRALLCQLHTCTLHMASYGMEPMHKYHKYMHANSIS